MTNGRVKVGMVGAGFILRPHALAVAGLPHTSLHAIADTSRWRAEDAARQFGFDHALASVDELAASDCDVVHVLLPPFLHLQAAETLLKTGKSVFLEKPMGLSAAECERLGKLAEKRNLRLGVNHNFLFLPGYEKLRTAFRAGEFGRIDHLSCNWHFELPQLRSGPFDAWMLSAPANLFFELGPHIAAFILDLLGEAQVTAAHASKPLELPTGQQAFRSWSAFGEDDAASFALSVSTARGQPDRLLRLRASGGSAQFDFGRDIYWQERAGPLNPIFEAHSIARSIARQVGHIARQDRRRRLVAALRKSLASEPFTDSMARSIARFYDRGYEFVDPRQHWSFGAKVIDFCEQICDRAGVGKPSNRPISVNVTTKEPAAAPTALVVGGTGFIGRRLVARLIDNGIPVRVLSRSRSAAGIAFAGMPVEVHEGHHGNRDVARAALVGIKTVYHLAKCEGKKWEEYVRGDIEPTRVLAEEAAAAGVQRFIYTGTIDSYDSASARSRITGETPLDCRISRRNLYARSKAACEAVLKEVALQRGLPLIIMRPGIVIGEGTDPAHLGVAQFASESDVRFWGSGEDKLPLVLVDDVADALVRAMDAPGIVGRSFVLTSEPMLSAREYVAAVGARSGTNVHTAPRAPWRYWLADLVKEAVKNAIRHPNRRRPSLHDWRCRAQRSRYDSAATREALGWEPVADRDTLVDRGIHAAVDAAIGRTARTA
jgi:predicted dehydrogenase/nucleoside-diphosphate-sugar epimerase